MGRLEGKVAIITGGASGIGRAMVKEFAREGAKVLTMDLNEAGGQVMVEEVRKEGGSAIFVKGSVADEKDVDRMVSTCINEFKKLDILVNNAGVAEMSAVSMMTTEQWFNVINTNLTGTFFCIRRAVPEMEKNGKGKIINISSIDAKVGGPFLFAYAASKGGVLSMTINLAVELAPYKINVNAILPGFILTGMTEIPLSVEELKNEVLQRTPLNRIGMPEDVAKLAVYLASDDSDFVTGQAFVIDGGYTAL